ncbi:hypothetical protein [Lysinibacillus sp. G4S2]|nr:hypothetical protein [Lysinibacillus sp. G4S2]MDM5247612.1 hypothetical protein [Lysinibacillus sp. G4S2]
MGISVKEDTLERSKAVHPMSLEKRPVGTEFTPRYGISLKLF